MFDDSIEGIYDTLKACAMISKQACKYNKQYITCYIYKWICTNTRIMLF